MRPGGSGRAEADHRAADGGFRHAVAEAGFALGWAGVRRLPESAAYAAFREVADMLWRRQGPGVARLEANLRRVVGPELSGRELRRLSREGMRSYSRYWCDTFRLPDWDEQRLLGRVDTVGEAYLRDTLAAGSGLVAALPHMGNWDHVGAWACRTGLPVTTVAERLRPESLYDRFVAVRQGLGMEVLPLTGGANPMETLTARAREGHLVCLLAERDLRSRGVPVTFFGAPTTMPAGPAMVSLLTGAPLHPVSTSYDEGDGQTGGHRLVLTVGSRLEPPAVGTTRDKVTALTQALASSFEERIAAAPQDWHMLQRIWPEDGAPE